MSITGINTFNTISPYSKKQTEKSFNNAISTKDMTMEEYKKYVNEKISKIPFHPSQRKETEYVTISEEGYQAMKEDPEYEQWVFNHIGKNRQVDLSLMTNRSDYISGTCYHFFGAAKEEYHGESYNNWKNDSSSKGKESKRAKGQQERKQQYQKAFFKKQELEQIYDKIAMKRAEYSKFLQNSVIDRNAFSGNAMEANVLRDRITSASNVSSQYNASGNTYDGTSNKYDFWG